MGTAVARPARLAAAAALVDLGVLLVLLLLNAARPSLGLVPAVGALFWGFVALASLASLGALIRGYSLYPTERKALFVVGLIVALTLVAHFYIIDVPPTADCYDSGDRVNGCIGDESYYVPAAEGLVQGRQCSISPKDLTSDCNLEHPFLSKAFVGAGIAVFGDNTFGWRVFQVLLGTFSLPLLYLLVRKVGGDRPLAYVATVLLGLDTMFFVHSSAALIDVHMVFFSFMAFVAYFYRVRVWKLDRFAVSGALMGVAGLTKETAVFLGLTLLTYHLLAGEEGEPATGGGWAAALRPRLLPTAKIALSALSAFVIGMQAYDSLFAGGAFPLFVDHLSYMLGYGVSLTGPGYTYGPEHVQITPFSWLTYYWPAPYRVDRVLFCPNLVPGANLCTLVSYVDVGYYSLTNMLEAWMTFLWVPLAGFIAWKALRPRTLSPEKADQPEPPGRFPLSEIRVALLSLIWFGWNYFPYVLLFLGGRTTYPFYLLPAMPAIALGTAFFLTRGSVPRPVVVLYLAAAFVFFFVFFPYKGFLPEWLKVIIGN